MKNLCIFVVLIICSFTTTLFNTVQAGNLSSTGQIISTLPCAVYINDMTTAIVPYAREIKLTQGKVALVGWWWYEFLNQWKWCAHKQQNTFYAIKSLPRNKKKHKTISMHRIILGLHAPETMGDHEDHNGLNNLPHNLRECNKQGNARNRSKSLNKTSRFLGVYLFKKKHKDKIYEFWMTKIVVNNKTLYIKKLPRTAENEIVCAKLYDNAAKINFKEFANLNFKENEI